MTEIKIPDNLSIPQLMELLKDPFTLTPASYFPLGAFWIGVIFILAVYIGYRIVVPKTKILTVKFLAKREFKKIENKIAEESNHSTAILEISTMLRRVGIVVFGNEAVASLHSNNWANFIKEHDKTNQMTIENANVLAQAPYYSQEGLSSVDVKNLYRQSYDWSMALL